MNKLLITFILIGSLLFGGISTSLANKPKRIMIINGTFYYEIPSEIENIKGVSDRKLFMLSTSNGTRAIGIQCPSVILSNEVLQRSIPIDEVPEGEELLRRYHEAIANFKDIKSATESKPLINVGDTFPMFTAVDIHGKTWTNADVKGKVMALNLWFTGCGPCRTEMPELSEWKNEMPDVMFFSSTYETPEVARQVLDKVTFNWIPLVNDIQFKELIGTKGYPLTIVVNKKGRIVAFEYGTSPEKRAKLKEAIQSLR
ncbi:TlpA family protein disulfide reductase [Bacteroides sp. 214]|uniref:TlpA family protein disulfide reductase n=1 Tax=Bacteroides sp. 214 TaxID=2302935 RepID=UPI0013D2B1D2|nr:TlpA disulfide reductase family protein [Bacteroides sp. 214]NDW12085.1 TlpA family protein disulfide reductase [Bacteroides sp. 214]